MGASPRAQARALLAKSGVYQRRNTATNICLVAAPIFFCVLLAVLQLLANNLILSQRKNKCGCQCTSCCIPRRVQRPWTEAEQERIDAGEQLLPRYKRVEECSSLDTGYCERVRNATCRAYNDSACSLRFSSPAQAVFCPIPTPSSWPPIMPSPRYFFRAGGSTSTWLPYTGANMTAATALAGNLFGPPELPDPQPLIDVLRVSPLALLSLPPAKLLALLLPVLAPGGLASPDGEWVDAAQLSRLGLNFGSGLRSYTDYYLENGFINSNSNSSRVQFLLPWGICNATGIANVTNNLAMPVAEMILRYYNATYPVLGPLLRAFNITGDTLSSGALGDSLLSGISAACVDTLPFREFNTTSLDRRLYCGFGSARCDGTFFIREYGAAWDFQQLGPTDLGYNVYYNLSLPPDDGPDNYRIPPLLNAATRAWTRTYWGGLAITGRVRNRLLGLMSFPKLPTELKLDFSVLLGPLFYTWVVQMLMPSLLQQLVYEKEKRLRMMMKMHGLGDGAYWLVTYLWYLMLYIAYMIFFVVFGSLIRLKIFTTNSYSLQGVLYFIFGNNMIAFMFCLSSLFSSSRTATVVAFLYVFATGLIGELMLRPLMQENRAFVVAVQLVPGFSLYRGLFEFSEYSIRALLANTEGLRWADLGEPGNGMRAAWAILALEWPVFMVLGWYLEQVLNSGTGMRRHPLFFIRWMWHKPTDDLAALRAVAVAGGGGSSGGVAKGAVELTEGGVTAKYVGREAAARGPVAESGDPGGTSAAAAASGGAAADSGGGIIVGSTAQHAVVAVGTPASDAAAGGFSPRGGSPRGGSARSHSHSHSLSLSSAAVPPPGSPSWGPGARAAQSASDGGGGGAGGSASASVTCTGGSGSDGRILVRPASPAVVKAVAAPATIDGGSGDGDGGGGGFGGSSPAPPAKAGTYYALGGLASVGGAGGAAAGSELVMDAADVAAEESRVAAMDEAALTSTPIVIRGLAKLFPMDRGAAAGGDDGGGASNGGVGGGWRVCCGAGGVGGRGPRGRLAVRSLTLAIDRGECFGLLGPNGAGKTTTIHMLTGFLEPSAGDALVEGRSVRSRMPEIYRMMGVCPQDNLLWEQLTGEEHLNFYGRLKGLRGSALAAAVDAALHSVRLHINDAGKRRVGAYSGGMKRRLSVAIAFIGEPQVVYLDEPSTGLDPSSRRALWDVVRSHKAGRAIILTTHSMEEAETLCDRLGIFVDGRLACVGAPREITSRYAGYLVFTITVAAGHEDAARAFVAALSPDARLTYALGGTLKYELPGADVSLAGVFGAMAEARGRMAVLDWGVANATLEEVFIKFARQIGAETRDH